MNINYTETLILNYLLKNQDKNSNEYHIFNDIKSYDISSSDMVAEIIKLKRKRHLYSEKQHISEKIYKWFIPYYNK